MKINEYLNGIPAMASADGTTLKDTMMDAMDIWSNDACVGYCILAMQDAGYEREQIQEVLSKLRWAFDEVDQDHAAMIYQEF